MSTWKQFKKLPIADKLFVISIGLLIIVSFTLLIKRYNEF